MSTADYALGLDIGGTNLVGAVVARSRARSDVCADGQVLSHASIPTDSQRGVADGLQRIEALARRLVTQAGLRLDQISGAGIGSTAPIDIPSGTIKNPYTLPGWDEFPLGPHLTQTFGWPTCLIGDCDAAALGETWLGAGRGYKNVVYITVGTGIGAGIIINGQLHHPVASGTCEVGHMAMDLTGGPDCYCGARGCWEILAAAPAIVRRAKEAYAGTTVDLGQITAEWVSLAASQGDPIAQRLVHQTATYMGHGLANVMNMLGPEIIILGGGVMKGWPLFEPIATEIIQRRNTVAPLLAVKIAPAQLGLRAGVTGAAWAAFNSR